MTVSLPGDSKNFDLNWSTRPEAQYLHWTDGEPCNQVQLAFRSHWETFTRILKDKGITTGKSLEGRMWKRIFKGYFSQNGWDSTLLDLSETVISKARSWFLKIAT